MSSVGQLITLMYELKRSFSLTLKVLVCLNPEFNLLFRKREIATYY